MLIENGSYTALITPFFDGIIDNNGFAELIKFQISNGIDGIVAAGTTSESSTLSWNEHNKVIETVAERTGNGCLCIAGTGSNSTEEAIKATHRAVEAGVNGILLVDPYYNAPSSLGIRKEYVAPIASTFPEIPIIPYTIPSRTGAQLLPEDLALLNEAHSNIHAVKEATNSVENMRKIRKFCKPNFAIFSGDDAMTYEMMSDSSINASGVISVVSNVAPKAVKQLVDFLNEENYSEASVLNKALKPLFDIVTVRTTEDTVYGKVNCKFRNPLPIKTLMNILGMPSGVCRRPIGKMSQNGFQAVLNAARAVYSKNSEIFQPIENFFNVNIENQLRLAERKKAGLHYRSY